MNTPIAGVLEIGEQSKEMGLIVGEGVVLGYQNFLILTVPAAGPVFVGPAEAEGEIGLARAEDLCDRALKQLLTAEPIVVIAEAINAVKASEIGLLLADFRKAQIVVAEICGEMGLVVAGEERRGSGHVAPLGETRAPPLVIIWNGVVLGEVKGKKFWFHKNCIGTSFQIRIIDGNYILPYAEIKDESTDFKPAAVLGAYLRPPAGRLGG